MPTYTALAGYVVALAAIASATVAVVLSKIDAPTYIAIVGPLTGAVVGAGVHAAGVTASTAPAATSSTPPQP